MPLHAASWWKSQWAKPRRGDILITPHVSVGETDTLTSSKPRRGDTHAVQLTPDKAEGRSLGLSGKLPLPLAARDSPALMMTLCCRESENRALQTKFTIDH